MALYVGAVYASQGSGVDPGDAVGGRATAAAPVAQGGSDLGNPRAQCTVAARQLYVSIPGVGNLTSTESHAQSGTAGAGAPWGMSIRLDDGTAYWVGANAIAETNRRTRDGSSVRIPDGAGDYIEIKSVQPDWAVNPLTTVYGGYVYIE